MSNNLGDYTSPFQRDVWYVVRLANAYWMYVTYTHFERFSAIGPVTSYSKADLPVVLDSVDDVRLTLEELIAWLPEDLRKVVLYN